MIKIFPSLISANLLQLDQVITELDPFCAGYHLDVMDFHFVPNLTFGPDFINAIRQKTTKQLQVHLMVDYPEIYLDRLHLKENDSICVHIESRTNIGITQICKRIREKGLIASIAINPFTPLEALVTLPTSIEHLLVMSVMPGFSGQKFMPHTFNRIQSIKLFNQAHDLDFTLAVDGGITYDIAQQLVDTGVQELAIASAIFKSDNPSTALQQLSQLKLRETK